MTAPAKVFSGATPRPVVGSEEVAPVYRPKERSVRVQAYVPESFQKRLEMLGRVWTLIDKAKYEAQRAADPRFDQEPLKEWSEAEVVKRLLEAASAGAWEEIDGREPQSEADWARIEKKYLDRVKTASK